MTEMHIEIGAIASAHGIKGQFKVKAFCENPMDITAYGPLHLADGRILSVRAHSHSKGFVLCTAKEVTSRNEAEALRGQVLHVARDQMPDLDEDEIYHADLMGYELVARPDAVIGEIVGIYDFGAGTILEIKRPQSHKGKKLVMVPFADSYEPQIDDAHRTIVMHVETAWLDDSKPEGDEDGEDAS